MKILIDAVKRAIEEATTIWGVLGYPPFLLPDTREKYDYFKDGVKHEFFESQKGKQLLTRFELMIEQNHLISTEIFFLALLIEAINEGQLTKNHFVGIAWFNKNDSTSSGYFILSQLISEGLLEPKDHLEDYEQY